MSISPSDVNSVISILNTKLYPSAKPMDSIGNDASYSSWWNAVDMCKSKILDINTHQCACLQTKIDPMNFSASSCVNENWVQENVLKVLTKNANSLPDSITYQYPSGTVIGRAVVTGLPGLAWWDGWVCPGVYVSDPFDLVLNNNGGCVQISGSYSCGVNTGPGLNSESWSKNWSVNIGLDPNLSDCKYYLTVYFDYYNHGTSNEGHWTYAWRRSFKIPYNLPSNWTPSGSFSSPSNYVCLNRAYSCGWGGGCSPQFTYFEPSANVISVQF
jgi:hypothetical protein